MNLNEYLALFGVSSIQELNAAQHEFLTRLMAIETKRLDLVDAGANKRRWLIAKGEEMPEQGLLGSEATVDDDGNIIDGETQTDVQKALPPPAKAGMLKIATEAQERAMSLVNSIKGDGEMAKIATEAKAIATLLNSLASKYPSPTTKSAKEPDMVDDKKTDTKKSDDTPASPAVDDQLTIDGHAVTGPLADLYKDTVQKGGAKMKGARLEEFRKGVSILHKVLRELEGGENDELNRMIAEMAAGVKKSADSTNAAVEMIKALLEGAAKGAGVIPTGQSTGEDDLRTDTTKSADPGDADLYGDLSCKDPNKKFRYIDLS